MKRTLLLALIMSFFTVCDAINKDSINMYLEDFGSVVNVAENDYSMFKFKVTGKNIKKYNKFKNNLIKDIKTGKRDAKDAIFCYVGWFQDGHFFVQSNDENHESDTVYWNRRIEYSHKMEKYDPQFVNTKVDDETFLIRYVDCDNMNMTKAALDAFMASGCKNLIFDFRGNGGGQDGVVRPFVKLLYNKPGKEYGSVFRNTKANIERRMQLFEGASYDEVKNFIDFYEKCKGVKDEYVKWTDTETIKYDSIYTLPEKAAIIIDSHTGSASETFLKLVKETSSRTVIYGKDNSLGAADNGNVAVVFFDKYNFLMVYPTTYDTNLEEGFSFDKTGFSPDVHISIPYPKILTDNIDEWVKWVADDMKK